MAVVQEGILALAIVESDSIFSGTSKVHPGSDFSEAPWISLAQLDEQRRTLYEAYICSFSSIIK
jgi:hypothetical protein